MFGLTVDFIYLKDYASDGTDAIGFVQFWGNSPALDLLGEDPQDGSKKVLDLLNQVEPQENPQSALVGAFFYRASAFGPAAAPTQLGGYSSKQKDEEAAGSEYRGFGAARQANEADGFYQAGSAEGEDEPQPRPLPEDYEPLLDTLVLRKGKGIHKADLIRARERRGNSDRHHSDSWGDDGEDVTDYEKLQLVPGILNVVSAGIAAAKTSGVMSLNGYILGEKHDDASAIDVGTLLMNRLRESMGSSYDDAIGRLATPNTGVPHSTLAPDATLAQRDCKGAFGVVYDAKDTKSGQAVVCKVISKEATRNHNAIRNEPLVTFVQGLLMVF
ncbi:hypothetical protein AK812_SmicGene10270 [Symbiodinium microadriaticum]|uniref:Protein kinase domain-containing protein n=1 Tax=Symbiodinium microadriaticum TaxID=2951 RepID=A0A1Q9EGC8_SYMMI|nr:hypothetical protein AK812_SmicGene10270 [Symbiodinium microadriaticum]